MSGAFEVRELNGDADDGSDEYGERRVTEAYDHLDAALRFMEKMDACDLPQHEARLFVRERGTTEDVRVDVTISVRPEFFARRVTP